MVVWRLLRWVHLTATAHLEQGVALRLSKLRFVFKSLREVLYVPGVVKSNVKGRCRNGNASDAAVSLGERQSPETVQWSYQWGKQ